ncbi:type III polyketide synthase [Granulicella paludicola]|uniref:type III polyketide synthase n=1 Tax=Granulicella paludicola TaxID=474951 RepID=UPI0021E00348|nr:type III polyketide synthase [Granulicella paludicola]
MTQAYINRIATDVPRDDVHNAFVEFAYDMLEDPRVQPVFRRMAQRAEISRRYSVLTPHEVNNGFHVNAHDFYTRGRFPDTAKRMQIFERFAPKLAQSTLDKLKLSEEERRGITHVLVTSCTGLYAPGLDFDILDHLGLETTVERTMIGFMGCYAAINGLKQARHIVRSEPTAKVLLLNLELCTLHMQETQELEQVLSFLVFSDGCAASLISTEPVGFAMDSFRSVLIPETRDLITWKIRGVGFDMLLSGKVPGQIGKALTDGGREVLGKLHKDDIALWGVHPGGKTILDAVERGLDLPKEALRSSREVLDCFGNMSSATVMFVMEKLMQQARPGDLGCAMSFGPGLTAETMLFHAV